MALPGGPHSPLLPLHGLHIGTCGRILFRPVSGPHLPPVSPSSLSWASGNLPWGMGPEPRDDPLGIKRVRFSSCFPQTAAEWAEKMPKGPPPRSPKETAAPEILAQLHKAVASHYRAIAHEFENFDPAKTTTASRDEFRAICNRHVRILTDKQVRAHFGLAS